MKALSRGINNYDTVVIVWTVWHGYKFKSRGFARLASYIARVHFSWNRMFEWQCQYSSFLMHSSGQCITCLPSDVIACDEISQAFPCQFRILQAKSEAREGLAARLCISFAVYTSNPACCQDPVFNFRWPGSKTSTVVPIPGTLLLLMEYLDTVSSVTAKQIKT